MAPGEVQSASESVDATDTAPQEAPLAFFFVLGLITFGIFAMGFFFGHHAASLLREEGSTQRRHRNRTNPYGEIDDP